MTRHAVSWFAALGLLAGAAFWPSYLSRLGTIGFPVHAHALAMTAWCAMLVAQAWLIRSDRRPAHRALGRLSYALVPLIVLATLALARTMLRNAKPAILEEALYFFYLQLALLAVFGFAYAQAIRHRRNPVAHASYMVGTALALVDPILARLLFHAFAVGPPLMQIVTFAVIDGALVALVMWERRRAPRVRVFPTLLAVFVVVQIPTFFLYRSPAWRAFAEAFAGR